MTTGELVRKTTSLCATCKRTVPASLWRAEGKIVMRKSCDAHGAQEVLISCSAEWFDDAMSFAPVLVAPHGPAHPEIQGCPYDCGPCTSHEQRVHLPVVPITSACNLDCPICYTHNKG